MRGTPVKLPPCGIFIGTGVYPMSKDYMLSTLVGHPAWTPQTDTPAGMIDRIIDDNQGNLAQVWGYARGYAPATIAQWIYALDEIGVDIPDPDWESGQHIRSKDHPTLKEHADRRGAGLIRFIRLAAERGLATLFIYTDAAPQWSAQLRDMDDAYLGYDFGERFTFSLDNASLRGKPLEEVTLEMLADDLIERVRSHVEERRKAGWGNIYATSSNFHVDYEIAAGADIPLVEDFAFRHLNMASALSRGLYRQYDLPLWGSHLAHEHYSWIPYRSEHKFDLLRAAMYQKYMAGCKMLINESGNWFVEASLCEDSPRFDFPRPPLSPKDVTWSGAGELKFIPYIEEARLHYDKIDYSSWICQEYRRVYSDFYDFVKANGTPEGQPETTVAIAKGNYDLCYHTFNPNNAVAGAFALGDINPAWFEAAPEQGWDIVKDVFYPLREVLDPYPNHFLSGTPYGMVDIVSFAKDRVDAAFLSANYRALLFAGWNTASLAQYEILKQYVYNGGTLFLSIPHLSTNMRRNYTSYPVEELVHGGDFSELCGVRVIGPGERFYWATVPPDSTALGVNFPRRFGIIASRMGRIEITDPTIETLAIDDEQGDPVLLRRRYGKGSVYFLNSWAYPGAMNTDEGPGARTYTKGLIGTIYQHIAEQCRGSVWITPPGSAPVPGTPGSPAAPGSSPGTPAPFSREALSGGRSASSCEFVAYSYFPESKTICLLNVDFKRSHEVMLHHFGQSERVMLDPGQFMLRTTEGDQG